MKSNVGYVTNKIIYYKYVLIIKIYIISFINKVVPKIRLIKLFNY